MIEARLNRLFDATSGRCVSVAIDHGIFGEGQILAGAERLADVIVRMVEADPDVIQLGPGSANLLQRHRGRHKPTLALRVDVTNVYAPGETNEIFSEGLDRAVEWAVRLDAGCVVVNLLDVPGDGRLRRACIANIARLRSACDVVAMPLMVEPLVLAPGGTSGYGIDGRLERILPLVRQAVELGADLVKADPTEHLDDYHRVIEVSHVPILVRGGSRVETRELLQRTRAVIDQGAAGVVYGRNVFQHPSPGSIVRALRAIVHADATVDAALTIAEG